MPDPQVRPFLFDVVLRLAREVVLVRGGTANEVVLQSSADSTLEDEVSNFPIDTFRGGTMFIPTSSTYLPGTTPYFGVITQHSGSLFTFTRLISGAATAIGPVPYYVADHDIPLDVMISAVNEALRGLTLPEVWAENYFTVTAKTREYDIPQLGSTPDGKLSIGELFKVEVATSLTAPYNWEENRHWDVIEGVLVFASGFEPTSINMQMRLTYRRQHTDLLLVDDFIPYDVNLDYLHWMAVENVAKYGKRIHGDDPKRDWPAKIQEAEVRAQRFANHQVHAVRSPRLADY